MKYLVKFEDGIDDWFDFACKEMSSANFKRSIAYFTFFDKCGQVLQFRLRILRQNHAIDDICEICSERDKNYNLHKRPVRSSKPLRTERDDQPMQLIG
jgi:hypothetical protein